MDKQIASVLIDAAISIDDGTLRAAFRPMTKDFLMASDGVFVGESENQR